ncbi:tumor necrosis factor receptor superfamily member 6B-like isoform X2 [Sminthopsis crassicaudata]|uniref:tumor necrosis factor receptor superfamily member 6B-like isoform X2 n=1 Tax=Sminthopsis crassicaudata TaxID=9301 RepID=UPI003D68C3B3
MTKSRSQPTFCGILYYSLFLDLIAFPNLAHGLCTEGLYEVDGECCRPCHAELSLVIRQECSSTSNTVCSCSPGYFCTDMKGDDCELCVPHQVCRPGQYVKSRGTERNNTICEECQAGTFSMNGILDRCLPWTNCTAQGLYEERPGTAITDARCSQDSHNQNISLSCNLGIGIGIGIIGISIICISIIGIGIGIGISISSIGIGIGISGIGIICIGIIGIGIGIICIGIGIICIGIGIICISISIILLSSR